MIQLSISCFNGYVIFILEKPFFKIYIIIFKMLTKKSIMEKRNTFTPAGGEAKKLIRERERERKHLRRSRENILYGR